MSYVKGIRANFYFELNYESLGQSCKNTFSTTQHFFTVHEKQDLEGHRCSAWHRSLFQRGLHSKKALRKKPSTLRVSVRQGRHGSGSNPGASRITVQEEGQGGLDAPAPASSIAGVSGLQGFVFQLVRSLRGLPAPRCRGPSSVAQQLPSTLPQCPFDAT